MRGRALTRRIGVALALGIAGAVPAGAEGRGPVVVELYTSQGCSSCPPADEMMHSLARRGDVLALALHVDYWDYIGWADTFARPEFTRRQEAYAEAAGEHMVYTPQLIVGGTDHLAGLRPMELMDRIAAHAALPPEVTLRLERQGEVLRIGAEAAEPRLMVVQIVRFDPEETVEILRGENAGRTETYVNIVTSWERLAEWDGRRPFAAEIEVVGPEPVAIIVQEAGPGMILSAAALR